jgi:hypothetical protein
LEPFIEARESAVLENNILAGGRGAGLFPENLHRMLHQFLSALDPAPDSINTPALIAQPSLFDATDTLFFLSSSPLPPATL